MLDRKTYEERLQKAREEQLDEIVGYLSDYLKLNAKVRELPVFEAQDEEDIRILRETPIPRTGRPPKEVADELVKHVFEKSMTIQHPRFFPL